MTMTVTAVYVVHDGTLHVNRVRESPADLEWQGSALCAQTDPELFFPEKVAGRNHAHQARQVCMACPVRAECLEYALTHGEEHGVWGATTYKQRRKILLSRASEAA